MPDSPIEVKKKEKDKKRKASISDQNEHWHTVKAGPWATNMSLPRLDMVF